MSEHLSPHERALLDALQRADTPEADEKLRVKQRLFAELGLGAAAVTAATVASQVSHAASTAGGALQGVATGAAALETGGAATLAPAKAATTTLQAAGGAATKAAASGGFTSALVAKVSTTKLLLGLTAMLTTAGGTAAWFAGDQKVAVSQRPATTQPFSASQQPLVTQPPPVMAPSLAITDASPPPPQPSELARIAETPAKPQARRPRATDVVASDPQSTLHDEAALLAVAQQRISQGDPRGALTALVEHRTRFPQGALSLERQATTALARCLSGQMAQGRSEAERFRRQHPNSPMVKRLESACKLNEQ